MLDTLTKNITIDVRLFKNRTVKLLFILILVNLSITDTKGQDEENLAEAAQNPVGDLISIPFQNNTSFGIGPSSRTQNVLNIQPVYPIHINEKWNVITRTIIPIISQPDVSMESGGTTGIGDISFTAFLSPKSPGKVIWGAGMAISIPTAANNIPGFGKWAIGPSAVALTISGPWVAGAIISNVWSIGGDSNEPDVNFFLLQYFVNYNMEGGMYLVSAPIITNNWKVDDSLILPFGAGIGKIFRLGKLPINSNVQAYYNAVTPDGGPSWSTRVQIQLMFPK
jgi:hypothetical protein